PRNRSANGSQQIRSAAGLRVSIAHDSAICSAVVLDRVAFIALDDNLWSTGPERQSGLGNTGRTIASQLRVASCSTTPSGTEFPTERVPLTVETDSHALCF
ncbi:hypothetical protein, partial [Mycobacterium sp.]|uniref:hypothetical protein n=1 Tax=Mycobacterium sp. TaxID=1785 RepID=UPI003C958BFC